MKLSFLLIAIGFISCSNLYAQGWLLPRGPDLFSVDSLNYAVPDGDKVVSIFPNPSTGNNIRLSCSDPSNVVELRIYDSKSRLVFRSVTKGSTPSFELWPTGLYYFNFIFRDGEEVAHEVYFI